MPITVIPTRTNADPNSATDINTLIANDQALYASLGGGSGGGGSTQLIGRMAGQIYAMPNTGFYYPQGDTKTYTRFAGKLKIACTGSNTILSMYKNGALSATLSINYSNTSEHVKTISVGVVAGDELEVRPTQVGSTIPGSELLWNIKGA